MKTVLYCRVMKIQNFDCEQELCLFICISNFSLYNVTITYSIVALQTYRRRNTQNMYIVQNKLR